MLKHVVMFRMKDESKDKCNELRELFLSMKNEIPQIIKVTSDLNIRPGVRAYDVQLEVFTKDLEELEVYVAHPYHAGTVGNYLKKHVADIVVADFF